MRARTNLNREFFQRLLADAFAVQESGIDARSLLSLVELEKSIAMRERDVDQVLHLIAEDVRKVANATGSAIALLNGDQLVYRAGSGSAATYVGRPGRAVLSPSAHGKGRNEILRAEDTETDTRIEAAICRQFGARSLLILPIYQKDSVAGVVEVMFSDKHRFREQEVRTYRLMAGLVNEVVFCHIPVSPKKAAAAEHTTVPRAVVQLAGQTQRLSREHKSPPPANSRRPGETFLPVALVPEEFPFLMSRPKVLTTISQPINRAISKKYWWNVAGWRVAAAGISGVLVVGTWVKYDHHFSSPANRPASKSSATAQKTPIPVTQTPQVLFKNEMPTARAAASNAHKPVPARPRVSQNGIEYVGDDVTIRHITSSPQVQAQHRHVHFANDVTVRHFPSESRIAPGPGPVVHTSSDSK